MFGRKSYATLWIGLAALIMLSVVAPAQKQDLTPAAISKLVKQSQLTQPGIKPAPFPLAQQSRSLAFNRRALSIRPAPGLAAALDSVKPPAAGRGFPSRGFSNTSLAPSAVAAPVALHQGFNPSQLNARKLRTATRPNLSNAQQ